jgi:hypothetical protein
MEMKLKSSSSYQLGQPFTILLQAAWFGLFFGFVEAGVNVIRRYVLHRMIGQSEHFVWMVPLTVLGLYIIIGFIWIPLSIRWTQLQSLKVMVPIFIFIGIMAIYYVKPKIHWAAAMILAAGISFQAGRVIDNHRNLYRKTVLITLPFMIMLLLGVWFYMRFIYQ